MIRIEKDGPLWTAVIDRPDKANSLTLDMLERLAEFAENACDNSDTVRVIVLSGQGKVFSAGADLDEARAGLATSPVWERLSGAIAAFPGLSIAALNGTLAGGAMGMALACDLRIAVPNAKFFYPVMKLGFLPQPSDPGRMTALMGAARTKLMLMGGQKLNASDALSFGLIDRIVEGDLSEAVQEISADTLAARSEIAQGIKELCT